MVFLLYSIAAMCALIGIAGGLYASDVNLASNGLLAAVLCGAFGRIVHLLTRIESHLRLGQITARMREERRIADALFPQRTAKTPRAARSVAARVRSAINDLRS